MIPKTSGRDIQLIVIQPFTKIISKQIKKKGNKNLNDDFGRNVKIDSEKFIKENYLKVWYNKEDIGPYGQYVGTKGQVVKSRTLVYIKPTTSYLKVAHSLPEMEKVMHGSHRPDIGFNK